ncbi:peptidase S8/S53 domain-containing protein [Podospora australis]|uniref:Peptidase S8/S53 domain-containing protein n=1 Tax=Podospora australis TaxID=1536484 RepID=A0AAN6WMM2_9PEZI|nr:peptidase S8/S53 domain-containing protein [Podospora australis]
MLFITAALAALLPGALAAPATDTLIKRAPLHQARSGKVIPGQYIVKFKDGASSDTVLSASVAKIKTTHVFKGAFKGFAGALDAASLDAIRKLPGVEFVEEDAVVTLQDLTVPGTGTGSAPRAIITQTGAPWNLARLTNHPPGSTIYRYDNTAGAGTCSYVIATGIQVANTQFGGRAIWGANFADASNTDGNGHGTNIAGIIGSTSYGVARQTKLIAVKVLNASGSGTNSGVIQGINFVATDKATRGCPNGVVASMTIGGSTSTAVNTAVNSLVAANVLVAVSSGSNNMPISGSPASAASACTVGSTTQGDVCFPNTDYGPLLDIWAPGQNIITTTLTGTGTLTSATFGAAHVAGLGAYLLGLPSALTGSGLCSYMQSIATVGVLTGVPPNTVNLLAYNGWDLP